jgi:outer membrane protein
MSRPVPILAVFLLLISWGNPPLHAQGMRTLNLKQAEEMALKNHPRILAAQLTASAAKETVTEVRSAYFPLVYGSLTGAGAESGSRIAAGGLNNPIIFNRYANGVTVSQLVTDFGRTGKLVQTSRLNAQSQQEEVEATRADILLQVDRAYFTSLRAQSVLRVAEETVKARQLVVDKVTALEKSQLKSSLDVSFANVNLAEAKLLLVQARNELQGTFADLSKALGFADQQVFELAEEPMPPAPTSDPSPLIAQAMRNRPELLGQRLSRDAAQQFAKAERALSFPTISFIGSAGWIPAHQSTLQDSYAAAGMNVNIPIFNGHLFSARRTEAELRLQAAEQRVKDLENRVTCDVRLAWLNANTAYQRLDLTSKLQDEATQALKLAQARYNLGLSSVIEFSQAQLNETQAEIQEASAKYEFQIQNAVLNYELGSLP